MRNTGKLRVLGTAVLLFSLLSVMTAMAGWNKDAYGWWYDDGNGGYCAGGIYEIDGSYYAFNNDGYMFDNTWMQDSSGNWYYAKGGGALARNEWIGNYWLGSDFTMATNAWVDGGQYYVDGDGAWVPGKVKETQNARTDITPDWVYGEYQNKQQTGFSETKFVELQINWSGSYDASGSFYLSNITGGYDLYDRNNPGGDQFNMITFDNRYFECISTIDGERFSLEYDGIDTVTINWQKDPVWLSGDRIVLKKVRDYEQQYLTSGVG